MNAYINMEDVPQKIEEARYKLPKDILDIFCNWLERNNYSYGTITKYGKLIKRILKSDGRKTMIYPSKIKNFLGIKTNTYYQGSTKKFIQFLSEEHNIEVSLIYPRMVKSRKETYPLTREEIGLLINSMPDDDRLYRFRLLTELIAKTGMRVSEAIGLRVKNIDFVTWVRDKEKPGRLLLTETKNNVMRSIPVSKELMKKLSDQCKDLDEVGYTRKKDSFVFDFGYYFFIRNCKRKQRKAKEDSTIFCYDESIWDIKYVEKSTSYFRIILRKISKKVLNKDVNPHLLRHSYASYLDSKGVRPSIIQRLLGHKSLATTSGYLHPSEEEMATGIIND